MLKAAILLAAALVGDGSQSSGDYHGTRVLDAASVAITDFKVRLRRERGDWEYGAYVKNIRNYAIGLSESERTYVVVLDLRDIPGRSSFNGGGARYVVDKKTLKIVSFQGFE